MLPDNIGARLFDAMGAGICLIDAGDRTIRFRNPSFASWFPRAEVGAPLTEAAPEIDLSALREGETIEIETKPKRRKIVIEVRVHAARQGDRDILILECQNISRLRETEAMIDSYVEMTNRKARDLEREKVQVEKLLLNLMPRTVYEEYKTFGSVTPRLFEPVSVIMLDFVGFTEMAAAADPTVTVAELNDIFTAFDRMGELHGCERIKTIGDCYMAVAGLPHPNPDHARSAAACAVKMRRYLERRNTTHNHRWLARIGIATGSVVGSVVGVQKYIYDVFGPAVNRAARLQQISDPMEITICGSLTSDLVDDYLLTRRREVDLAGFGRSQVAALNDREPSVSAA